MAMAHRGLESRRPPGVLFRLSPRVPVLLSLAVTLVLSLSLSLLPPAGAAAMIRGERRHAAQSSSGPALALTRRSLTADSEVKALVAFLKKSGYTKFSGWVTTHLNSKLRQLIAAGNRLTVLAPVDKAFGVLPQYWKPTRACEPRPFWMASLHVLTRLVTTADLDGLQRGARVVTLTPVALTKASLQGSPLEFAVTNGPGDFLGPKAHVKAKVLKPDTYSSTAITVHGIDTVLKYPSGTGC